MYTIRPLGNHTHMKIPPSKTTILSGKKKEIYNNNMRLASKQISTFLKFDLNEISKYMKTVYTIMCEETKEEKEENFYTIRKTSLLTLIHSDTYKNIISIFFDRVDYMLEQNEDIECKESTCTKEEEKEECKKCFKYKKNTKGILLTQSYCERKGKKLDDKNSSCMSEMYYEFSLPFHILYDKEKVDTIFLKIFETTSTNELILGISHTKPMFINQIISKIAELWTNIKDIKDCYMIHWLFCNATPFMRGSASCAKVLLNAALLKINEKPVKETENYNRHSDWIAMFSFTFDKYYHDVVFQKMFEIDEEFDDNDNCSIIKSIKRCFCRSKMRKNKSIYIKSIKKKSIKKKSIKQKSIKQKISRHVD